MTGNNANSIDIFFESMSLILLNIKNEINEPEPTQSRVHSIHRPCMNSLAWQKRSIGRQDISISSSSCNSSKSWMNLSQSKLLSLILTKPMECSLHQLEQVAQHMCLSRSFHTTCNLTANMWSRLYNWSRHSSQHRKDLLLSVADIGNRKSVSCSKN